MIWKPGPTEKATLGWAGDMEFDESSRPLINYADRGETQERVSGKPEEFYDKQVRLLWDSDNQQWAFLLEGTCWELFTARFGAMESNGDIDLATGLARILCNLNRKSTTSLRDVLPTCPPPPDREAQGSDHEHWGLCPRLFRTPQRIFALNKETTGVWKESLEQIISSFIYEGGREPITLRRIRLRRPESDIWNDLMDPDDYLDISSDGILLGSHHRPQHQVPTVDGFSRFPTELLLHILAFVPFEDLPKLRLASKVIAAASALAQLPTLYWKIAFQYHYPCAIPRFLGKPDWRTLCFSMRPLFRPRWSRGPPGRWGKYYDDYPEDCGVHGVLEIKQQFWDRLDGLRDLICRKPRGVPVDSLTDRKFMTAGLDAEWQSHRHEMQLTHLFMPQLHECHNNDNDNDNDNDNSRTKNNGYLSRTPWLAQSYRLRSIGVTTTQLGKKTFISGLRLYHKRASDCDDDSEPEPDPDTKINTNTNPWATNPWACDEFGYTAYAPETALQVLRGEDIGGIKVQYSTSDGSDDGGRITSIKFILVNVSTGHSRETKWVGTGVTGDGCRLASAVRGFLWLPFAIVGCFDVCLPKYLTAIVKYPFPSLP